MTITQYSFCFILILVTQGFAGAQNWTSYQSPNQINDLVDNGTELLLATDAGLVVINKSTLEKTTFNKANSNLSNNHIQTITKGQNGSIWIGTYDIVLFQFTGSGFENATSPSDVPLNQNANMYDLKIAPNGDFWLGTTDGVYHREGQTWSRYAEEEFGPNYFETWDIEIKDDGDVFVAGIDVHRLVEGEWVNTTQGSRLSGYRSADLFTSSMGYMFLAGDLDQIGFFDGENWQDYDIDVNGSEIVHFTEDAAGSVFYNTRQDGIFKLENGDWRQQTDLQSAAFNNSTSYFHIDEAGNRWMNNNINLSVNDNGNLRSTLIAEHTLETDNVSNVHKGDNGKMYFITGSRNNISVLDTDGNWSFLPKPPTTVPFVFLNDILAFSDDDIWLASGTGLHHYNGSEWTLANQEPCFAIDVDSQGKIYARTTNMIYMLDADGTYSEYNQTNSPLTDLPIGAHGIDAEDKLWIGTGDFDLGNVVQTVSSSGEWTTYTAADHPAIERISGDFHFDNDGNTWVSDDAFGALKFDGTSWTNPIRENVAEITNGRISSIKSDANGKLYMAHEYGLVTLQDGQWDNLIIEGVTRNNSSDSNIEFDDEGILWWANGRTGVFSYNSETTSTRFSAFQAVSDLTLYPNPTETYTTLDFSIKDRVPVKVAIYNQLGQLASTTDLGQLPEGTYQQEIDVDRLPTGFYTVQLQIGNRSSTAKLIVR